MTSRDLVIYLTECTLVTVADLCLKKNPPVGELNRQIRIAQQGVNWAQPRLPKWLARTRASGRRIIRVVEQYEGDVSRFAKALRAELELPTHVVQTHDVHA